MTKLKQSPRRGKILSPLDLAVETHKKQEALRGAEEAKTESKTETKNTASSAEQKDTQKKPSSERPRPPARKAPSSPLEGFLPAASNSSALDEADKIYNLPFETCQPWQFSDRLDTELGDIEGLIQSIAMEGQQQPGLVRALPYPDGTVKYEIIFGCRRWKACSTLKIPFLARIADSLTDKEAADRMITENLHRENISEFARCKSYTAMLDAGLYRNQGSLAKQVGLSEPALSNLFVFNKLPAYVISTISDFSHVSIRTAKKLHQLSNEPYFKTGLSTAAQGIASGEIHAGNLQKVIQPQTKTKTEKPLQLKKGAKVLMETRKDAKGNVHIKISKDLALNKSLQEIFDFNKDKLA